MGRNTRKICLVATSLLLPLMIGGCLKRSPWGRAATGGAVLASVGGMDKDDQNLRGIRYQLLCERDGKALEAVTSSKRSDEGVTFPAKNLADGDQCALEVRADTDDQRQYAWFGVDGKGNPLPGLFYSSDRQPIESGRLSLTLFKLYRMKPLDAFSAQVAIRFQTEAGQSQPVFNRSIALLRCGEKTHPSAILGTSQMGAQTSYMFPDLSLSELTGLTCDKLIVLNNNEPVYGTASPLSIHFSQARQGQNIDLGVFAAEPWFAGDWRSLRRSSFCAESNKTTGRCLATELPRDENHWFATVVGTRAGQSVRLVVTGKNGFTIDDDGKLKSVEDMNRSMGTDASPYRFYHMTAETFLKSSRLTSDLNTKIQPIAPNQLRGVELSHIERVTVHGFREVEESRLNGQKGSPWFALTTIRTPDQEGKFLIAGSRGYMRSDILAEGRHLTWDAYKKDRDEFGQRYLTYALTDEGILLSSCSASLDYFLDELSQLDESGMSATSQHPIMDACVVQAPDQFDDADVTFQWFLWGWHEFSL